MINLRHKEISIGSSVLLSLIFIWIIVSKAVNFPGGADDFIFFVRQLHNKWLTVSETKHIFNYFFAPAFGIHTKMFSRILGLLSYGVFGTINFKFLIIVGNLIYLFVVHKLADTAVRVNKEEYLRPILLSLLLIPLTISYRPIFATGFSMHILFAFLCFLFLTKKKIGLSFLFFLLTAFNAGAGVFTGLVSFIALVFFSIREKKYIIYALLYLGAALGVLSFLFSYRTPATASGVNLSFDALVSYMVYVAVFIQKSITYYFVDYQNIPSIHLIIGFSMIATLIYLFIKKFKQTIDSPFFYLCLYCMMLGLLAAIVRSKGIKLLPNVDVRYEHYSVFFIASFTALLYGFISSKKIKVGVGIFFFILFLTRFGFNVISNGIGYDYDVFTSKNGNVTRELISNEKYQYLHGFKYEYIAQNESFVKEPYIEDGAIVKKGIKLRRYLDIEELSLIAFKFVEDEAYEDIRVLLYQGRKRYYVTPHRGKANKYYCVIAKNGDLPKGNYKLAIWFKNNKDEQWRKFKLRNNQTINIL